MARFKDKLKLTTKPKTTRVPAWSPTEGVDRDGYLEFEDIYPQADQDNVAALAGGTTDQVLKKNSATDFDYSWQDEAGGGGGTSILPLNITFDAQLSTPVSVFCEGDGSVFIFISPNFPTALTGVTYKIAVNGGTKGTAADITDVNNWLLGLGNTLTGQGVASAVSSQIFEIELVPSITGTAKTGFELKRQYVI